MELRDARRPENGPNGRVGAGVGTYGSSVIYNGRPHVFYRDGTVGDLRHGYYNGSFWAFETLTAAGGGNGHVNWDVAWTTSVVLYNGRPHVFYWDSTNGDLRHAYYNGVAWAFETLDGNGGADDRPTRRGRRHLQRSAPLQRSTARLLLHEHHR